MTGDFTFDYLFFRARVGMYACLNALGVGPGDDVILQAYTCVAVPEAILATGATPKYADVAEGGVTMDPVSLRAQISKRTKAIIIQHTFGIPADMPRLMKVARSNALPVIEDCAHTYWSEIAGRPVGTEGVAACYSLDWGKPLVAGVGGGIVLNDQSIRPQILRFANQLSQPPAAADLRMRLQFAGFKAAYHPSRFWMVKDLYSLLSRRGVAQQSFNNLANGPSPEFGLRILPSVKRRLVRSLIGFNPDWVQNMAVVEAYQRALQVAPAEAQEISAPARSRVMYQRFPVWVTDKPKWLAAARKNRIELSDWFESAVDPLGPGDFHLAGYELGSCPNAEAAARHIVSLPCNHLVTAAWAERAARTLLHQASAGSGITLGAAE